MKLKINFMEMKLDCLFIRMHLVWVWSDVVTAIPPLLLEKMKSEIVFLFSCFWEQPAEFSNISLYHGATANQGRPGKTAIWEQSRWRLGCGTKMERWAFRMGGQAPVPILEIPVIRSFERGAFGGSLQVESVGEGETSLVLATGSHGWPNTEMDTRQINGRKRNKI